ncbi:hypothetical protein BGZ65_005158 [Modicella reniformis]|uniref:DNA replication complex GINS protein PSF3 n=1 Tax=Modicella reniformis TaxID=1440133 RepID=A0A9P6MGS0_9FUNG|nr:hypothetical protein BGZ65_005158 [Modicella reniformis]
MDIETPEFFGPKIRNALRADATVVDLPKLIDDPVLAKVLEEAFKARLQMTMDHTQSGGSSVNSVDYLNCLDDTERDLYKAGLESSASVHHWNQQSFGRIRSANEVLKRKLAA